jgi:putative ABC transport system substrate-binding protein
MKSWFLAFLIAVILALSESVAGAQQTSKFPRIGYIGADDPSSSLFKSFQQGLREFGYVEGQNIIIESRFAYGNNWRLTELALDLVLLKVDVIVTQNIRAARGATTTVPIVMTYIGDPIAAGIVATLDRPGGNVTGIGGMSAGLGGKWLELIKEVVPGISRVGVLYTPMSERESPMMKELADVARFLKVELQPSEAAFTYGDGRGRRVGGAFSWATRGQADALIVLPATVFNQNREYLIDLALKRRIPAIFARSEFARVGGLMAYGAEPGGGTQGGRPIL